MAGASPRISASSSPSCTNTLNNSHTISIHFLPHITNYIIFLDAAAPIAQGFKKSCSNIYIKIGYTEEVRRMYASIKRNGETGLPPDYHWWTYVKSGTNFRMLLLWDKMWLRLQHTILISWLVCIDIDNISFIENQQF